MIKKTHLRQKQIAFLTTPCNIPSCTRTHTYTRGPPLARMHTHTHKSTHTRAPTWNIEWYIFSCRLFINAIQQHYTWHICITVYIKCICGAIQEAPTQRDSLESPFSSVHSSVEVMRQVGCKGKESDVLRERVCKGCPDGGEQSWDSMRSKTSVF